MIVFQVLGLTLLAALAAVTVGAAVRGKLRRRSAAFWLLVWTAAAAAIAVPKLTMIVAHALGIGRGADLVLYCTILAILVGFFFLFARLRRLEEDLTRLVRHLAIREASDPSDRFTVSPTARSKKRRPSPGA